QPPGHAPAGLTNKPSSQVFRSRRETYDLAEGIALPILMSTSGPQHSQRAEQPMDSAGVRDDRPQRRPARRKPVTPQRNAMKLHRLRGVGDEAGWLSFHLAQRQVKNTVGEQHSITDVSHET